MLRIGGDPRDADVLREARVDRAREIVVITGDNDRNTDVAASIRTALRDAATPPACFLEMGSPELALALAAHEINSGTAVRTESSTPSTAGPAACSRPICPGPAGPSCSSGPVASTTPCAPNSDAVTGRQVRGFRGRPSTPTDFRGTSRRATWPSPS